MLNTALQLEKMMLLQQTVIHQVCLSEGKNGDVDADVDFIDYCNDIKFLGIDIDKWLYWV
jgi:hypothetical protein